MMFDWLRLFLFEALHATSVSGIFFICSCFCREKRNFSSPSRVGGGFAMTSGLILRKIYF